MWKFSWLWLWRLCVHSGIVEYTSCAQWFVELMPIVFLLCSQEPCLLHMFVTGTCFFCVLSCRRAYTEHRISRYVLFCCPQVKQLHVVYLCVQDVDSRCGMCSQSVKCLCSETCAVSWGLEWRLLHGDLVEVDCVPYSWKWCGVWSWPWYHMMLVSSQPVFSGVKLVWNLSCWCCNMM